MALCPLHFASDDNVVLTLCRDFSLEYFHVGDIQGQSDLGTHGTLLVDELVDSLLVGYILGTNSQRCAHSYPIFYVYNHGHSQ